MCGTYDRCRSKKAFFSKREPKRGFGVRLELTSEEHDRKKRPNEFLDGYSRASQQKTEMGVIHIHSFILFALVAKKMMVF
jgi:hypothetical protein